MQQSAIDYAKKFAGMKVKKTALQEARLILDTVPQIRADFENLTVPLEKKHIVIDHVFPSETRDAFKLLCDNNDFALFNDIYDVFLDMNRPADEKDITAELRCVEVPSEEQQEGIKDFLKKKFNVDEVILDIKTDLNLESGFIIRFKSQEFDWSAKGRAKQLKDHLMKEVSGEENVSRERIVELLRGGVESFDLTAKSNEVGDVKSVGDGIAIINGLEHAFNGEIVIFDEGTRGMVQDIRRNELGVILFGRDTNIHEGTRVVRTGKQAGLPVGEGFLGRVIDSLGTPVDDDEEIEAKDFRPVECKAPSIVDRLSVSVPMETGILSIDSMFPIGRGQRELIIGDRQTGKTSIATDTIINQKGKDVICIYVAIGQKASTVAKLVNNLKKNGAMDYTIVVQATASDPAPLQYIAPYAGTSLAEYFMYKGKDVLIVYDDLSKHAVAYRTISLLLERSPGREAYPGDVFYLHSRLLERSSRLTSKAGGGSITALPIIETQAGDVSAYIPTNVISITDGQIYLESELFFEGQRPAVNVGLSVSRVGGAAQTKAMKKAAGSLRIDLAQYKEMQVFTQFSSDLDESTRAMLVYGNSLMELLKQPLGEPMSMVQQVITLITAVSGKLFADIETTKVKEFQGDLLNYFETYYKKLVEKIETDKAFDDDLKNKVIEIANAYKEVWLKGEKATDKLVDDGLEKPKKEKTVAEDVANGENPEEKPEQKKKSGQNKNKKKKKKKK